MNTSNATDVAITAAAVYAVSKYGHMIPFVSGFTGGLDIGAGTTSILVALTMVTTIIVKNYWQTKKFVILDTPVSE